MSEAESPLREALEAALVANPDDLAAHSAYADYLTEQSDPRGEFIQVQLALEETNRSSSERARLQQRERELLALHQRQWLGELAPYLLDQQGIDPAQVAAGRGYQFGWSRGWLDSIDVPAIGGEFARVLAGHLGGRLLRRLVVREIAVVESRSEGGQAEMGEVHPDYAAPYALKDAPLLGNLREFQFGEPVPPEGGPTEIFGLDDLVPKMRRLKSLRVYGQISSSIADNILKLDNEHLRTLELVGVPEIALEWLAENPAMDRLSRLWIEADRAVRMGLDTEGIRALLRSPHMKRLRELRLGNCNDGNGVCRLISQKKLPSHLKVLGLMRSGINNRGARYLAESDGVQQLELLDVSGNVLTARGVQLLRDAVGGDVDAIDQRRMADDDPDHYDTFTE